MAARFFGDIQDQTKSLQKRVAKLVFQMRDVVIRGVRKLIEKNLFHLANCRPVDRQDVVVDASHSKHASSSLAKKIEHQGSEVTEILAVAPHEAGLQDSPDRAVVRDSRGLDRRGEPGVG